MKGMSGMKDMGAKMDKTIGQMDEMHAKLGRICDEMNGIKKEMMSMDADKGEKKEKKMDDGMKGGMAGSPMFNHLKK